jgi:hypothetical protein
MRAERAERERDEALGDREKPSASELLQKGGEWLGAARNWLKWHTLNGDRLTWGSNDQVEPPFTVAMIEGLAADVAVAAMRPQPTEKLVETCLLARWRAESELASARAEIEQLKERAEKAEARVVELEKACCECGQVGMAGVFCRDCTRSISQFRERSEKAEREVKRLCKVLDTLGGDLVALVRTYFPGMDGVR